MAVVTRSVEIPEAAVKAAWDEFWGPGSVNVMDGRGAAQMRRLLLAALPYLAPAGHADPHLDERGKCLCYCGDCINETRCFCGECVDAPHRLTCLPPAGDGGLREALTDLLAAVEASPCTFWACEGPDSEPQDMITCNPCRAVHEARKVLAAHPAAPAVPQPALPTQVELAEYLCDHIYTEYIRDDDRELMSEVATAVLAVLAGEQERSDG